MPRIIGDFVRSFLSWAKLPLGWVLGSRCEFTQDEISYVKLSKLHSLVVILGHLLLVLCHLVGCSISGFIQAIQVDSQLIIIATFVEDFLSYAGDSYFDGDYYFSAISETEGGLYCRGSRCSHVCPQNVGQLFWPCALCLD